LTQINQFDSVLFSKQIPSPIIENTIIHYDTITKKEYKTTTKIDLVRDTIFQVTTLPQDTIRNIEYINYPYVP
jgi:hypothetical protein